MRTIYIDSEFKCHVFNDESNSLVPIETDYFDDKCDAFVEGYRFIPNGEQWIREDGIVFQGEMISPWKNYSQLDSAQRDYEKQLLDEYTESLKIMGVIL